jgi:hypothetical protein
MFFHDWAQQPFYWGVAAIGHTSWNILMTAILVVVLAGVAFWFYRSLRSHPAQKKLTIYWGLCLFLLLLCFSVLIPYKSEIIHFPQYGILAVLLYPITRRYMPTLIVGTLLGVIDEMYQFFVLFTDRLNYLDFNDMLLNLVGVIFGLMLVFTLNPGNAGSKDIRSIWKRVGSVIFSPPYLTALAVVATGALLYSMGVFGYFNDSGALIPLYRNPASNFDHNFWLTTDFGVAWHLVTPRHGIPLLLLLPFLFTGLDEN